MFGLLSHESQNPGDTLLTKGGVLRRSVLIAGVALAFTLAAASLPSRATALDPGTTTDAYVTFVSPMTTSAAFDWAQGIGVVPVEMDREYVNSNNPDRSITTGLDIDPASGKDVTVAEYQSSLDEGLDAVRAELVSDGDMPTIQNVDAARATIAAEGYRISGMAVTADDATTQAMRADPNVFEVVTQSETEAGGDTNPPDPPTCSGDWWPHSGRIRTTVHAHSGVRYVYQTFNWLSTNLSNLQCHSRVTYEAEAWYDNYDGLHYLGSTKHHRWFSSMPQAYLDTEAFNPSNHELGYTIGTGDAKKLHPSQYYFTSIFASNGNASTDRGKVNGQRGHRFATGWCHRAWCIFPDSTEPLLPAWGHTVPGSNVWIR
jgi:hypothetical protein